MQLSRRALASIREALGSTPSASETQGKLQQA